MSATATSKYGAIPETDDQGIDESFDANNAYYLQGNGDCTPRKVFLVSVPLLGAALIVGGAVWYLLSDFNNLYPGRGGPSNDYPTKGVPRPVMIPTRTESTHEISNVYPTKGVPRPVSIPTRTVSTHEIDDNNASCSAHLACSKLLGECCPTGDGIFLSCCN